MATLDINKLPVAVWESVLSFNPGNIHQLERVSKNVKNMSHGNTFLIHSYFDHLKASLGQERLNQLFGRTNWMYLKADFAELTRKIYEYVRTTAFGIKLVAEQTKPPFTSGMIPATQLARIVKLRDQEEDDNNLIKIAPALLGVQYSVLSKQIEEENAKEREEEIRSLKAQAIRRTIDAMSAEERNGIQELNLANLKLTAIPKEIFVFKNLQVLDLKGNQIKIFSTEIGKLVNLRLINLSGNQLTTVPAIISQLVELRVLDLSGNQLTAIPAEMGKLGNLKILDLSGNKIATLPAEMGMLSKLRTLHLSQNQLKVVPTEMGNLSKLKTLYLDKNQLTAVPAEIGNLSKLCTFSLMQNQLTTIPAEFSKLDTLESLDLRWNQITSIPDEVQGLCKSMDNFKLY